MSHLTFERAVELYDQHLKANPNSEDLAESISAEQRLLEFLEWDEPDADGFGNEVRIILVASDFAEAKELVTTVNWLNEYELDIRCVRMKPYSLDGRTLLDVQTLVPLPELSDYQVATREKRKSERSSRKVQRDYTKYDLKFKNRTYTRLNKRKLVYHLISGAFKHGISAQSIQKAITAQCGEQIGRWMFTRVSGELDLDGINDQLTTDKRTRYFLDAAAVWREDGNTWILTNQWGGTTPSTSPRLLGTPSPNWRSRSARRHDRGRTSVRARTPDCPGGCLVDCSARLSPSGNYGGTLGPVSRLPSDDPPL